MKHDAHKQELKAGDTVTITGIINPFPEDEAGNHISLTLTHPSIGECDCLVMLGQIMVKQPHGPQPPEHLEDLTDEQQTPGCWFWTPRVAPIGA